MSTGPGRGGRMVGDSGASGSAMQKDVVQPNPPYGLTALVLLGSMAVSQLLPWPKEAMAGNVPPLLAQLHPSAGPWLPLAVVALASALVILPRSLSWPPWLFLSAGMALGWIVAITLAAQAHGLSAVTAPFHRPLEYYTSVPLVHALGPRAFAVQFPNLGARLALHARTHGPSSVLFLWLLWRLTGSLLGVSLLVTLVGVAGMAATYAIARELGDERAARLAAILFVCAPGVLIYSATSMDAVFMTMMAIAMAALVRFPRSGPWAVAAGVLWAVALSLTFGALVLALFAAGLAVVAIRGSGATPARASGDVARRALLVVCGLVLGGLLLWLLTGINLINDFRAASQANSHDPSRARPYLYWAFANVPAFLFVAGIPQAALLVHRTRLQWRARSFGFETVMWGVLVLSSLSGVFLGEVDHIWLFFIPPLAVVAGAGLDMVMRPDRLPSAQRPTHQAALSRVVAGSLGQALLIQVFLYTYW